MNSETKTDFPAAHSMDTTWFGVDDLGNIAQFETGENGDYPRVLNLELWCSPPEHWPFVAELAEKSLQCISYDFEELPGYHYDRMAVPETPANIRDLSPQARAYAEKGRLPRTNFLEMPTVKPAAHVLCASYLSDLDCMYNEDRTQLIVLPQAHELTAEMIAHYRACAEDQGLELVLPVSPLPPPDDFPAAHSMDTEEGGAK